MISTSSEESIGTKHGISGALDTGNAWLLVLLGCTACTGDFSGHPQEPVESADPGLHARQRHARAGKTESRAAREGKTESRTAREALQDQLTPF